MKIRMIALTLAVALAGTTLATAAPQKKKAAARTTTTTTTNRKNVGRPLQAKKDAGAAKKDATPVAAPPPANR